MRPRELSGLHDAVEPARAQIRAALRQLDASLEMPDAIEEMLANALLVDVENADTLRRHYLETMPRLRLQPLTARGGPEEVLFHGRVGALPRLEGAVGALHAMLREAGVEPVKIRFATIGELYAGTYYGACMPLLHAYPADVAYFARELAAGERPDTVIDRYLAAPLVHELAHFGRARRAIFPLYLDECVAGYLGIRLLPEFAYPRAGEGNAIFAAPWFAQVGQALVRAVGLRAVVRAHAGADGWAEALPAGLAAALGRLGWADWLARRYLHFLSDNFRSEPWMKLFFLAAVGGRSTR